MQCNVKKSTHLRYLTEFWHGGEISNGIYKSIEPDGSDIYERLPRGAATPTPSHLM